MTLLTVGLKKGSVFNSSNKINVVLSCALARLGSRGLMTLFSALICMDVTAFMNDAYSVLAEKIQVNPCLFARLFVPSPEVAATFSLAEKIQGNPCLFARLFVPSH